VLGGRESKSIRLSVGGCLELGSAVFDDFGSKGLGCGAFADPVS
jgi:hypothetical protein